MSDPVVALVTGASAGLGVEFTRQLAPLCSRIIVVARRHDRLQELAAELSGSAELVPIEADLTTVEGQTRVVEAIRQQGPLRYLVNNAGFSTMGPFVATDVNRELDMVRLHQDATLVLTRAALPAMCEAGQGYIINLASVGAFVTMKNTAVYGATKAFLNAFSVSLQAEVAASGVRVQSLCPGLTHTEIHFTEDAKLFDKSRSPQELWMDADAVVRESLAALEEDRVVVVPGAHNVGIVRQGLEHMLGLVGE
jgi:short-subunit dehydrogenase